ncbi:hypothetical protein BDN72DRAFT_597264 [Pluteus cervinus]|uniref:Uncharacterized protein n=1 Tax=Pluteus cervinus TaxID=181527 RepID=A0ACD3A1U3_9AGAR|nr:hypothetical protein BDN72DRAFT_597264 [Pluteus cervinus]
MRDIGSPGDGLKGGSWGIVKGEESKNKNSYTGEDIDNWTEEPGYEGKEQEKGRYKCFFPRFKRGGIVNNPTKDSFESQAERLSHQYN